MKYPSKHFQTLYDMNLMMMKERFQALRFQPTHQYIDVMHRVNITLFLQKNAIKDIIHDYARNNRFNNVNIEHDSNDVVDGVFMIGSYQVDDEKGFNAPERFKDVKNGSWLTTYKFENEELYKRVKSGEVSGFSIEGTFVMDESQFSSVNKIESLLDELIELAKK